MTAGKWGSLPDLLEVINSRVGEREVFAALSAELRVIEATRDEMMDHAVSMADIDTACEIRHVLDQVSGRAPYLSSAPCVAVIRCWKLLGASHEEAKKRMIMFLIGLVNEPVEALGLVGEFTA